MIGKKTGKENKKETKETIEQERNLLKITLEYMAKENETLKNQLEDMKITARSNKELLKEYVETITNKDKVVEKMNNTIEQLQSRLQSMEEYIKNMNQSGMVYGGSRTNRPTTPIRTVLLSNPGNRTPYKLSDNENTTGENVNPEIPEPRENMGYTTRNYNLKPLKFTKKEVLKIQKYEAVNTKDFFLKQNKIIEELNHLKNELVTFLEKNDVSKNKNNFDLDALTVNESLCSFDTNGDLKKINLKENFLQQKEDNFHRLEKILSEYNPDEKEIILFVDNSSNIWELIKRKDLSINSLSTTQATQDIISLNKIISEMNLLSNDQENRGVDLENLSVNNSELDLSRNTEMSVYNPIKETINNMSDIY